MNFKLVTPIALSALLMAGCSSAPEPTPAPEETVAQPTAPTTYKLNDEAFYAKTPTGAEITVNFGAEPPADVEAYREATGAEPVSYAHVTIDNRQGNEYVGIAELSVYDAEGNVYTYEDLDLYHMSEWGYTFTEDYENVMKDGTVITDEQASALDQMYLPLQEKYFDDGADPSEKAESWIAVEGDVPEEIVDIRVAWAGVGSDIYMVPLSEKDEYVVPEAADQNLSYDPQVVGPPEAESFGTMTYDEWVANGSDCNATSELSQDAMIDAAWDCA